MNEYCHGCRHFVPVHFFCSVIPVRRSLRTVTLASLLLFTWNFLLSVVVLSIIAGLRSKYEMPTPQMHTALGINVVTDAIIAAATVVLYLRGTHLVWLVWTAIGMTLQVLAGFIALNDDFVELFVKKYLVTFTSSRVLAFLDLYFVWTLLAFTWFHGIYLWFTVLSIYRLSRLTAENIEELKEQLKDDYEKEREKAANDVYHFLVNEKYLAIDKRMSTVSSKKQKSKKTVTFDESEPIVRWAEGEEGEMDVEEEEAFVQNQR